MATPSEQHTPWAFWLACGLSAIGGVVLLVVSGGSSRLGDVVIPFVVAALAFAACGLLVTRGRPVATLLYFVASLAIVYGILAMLTLPLRLAVIGTCPPAPATCISGLEPPMTSNETTALGVALALGILAILTGFFGLAARYRREARVLPPPSPPTRRIAPVNTRIQAPPEVATPEPVASPTLAPPESEPTAEPEPEPMLELAATAEPGQLPAVGTEDPPEVAHAAPTRKSRRRRAAQTPAPSAPPTGEQS